MTLSPRLAATTRPSIPLTQTQIAARDRVAEALASGRWRQRAVPCFCGELDSLTVAERDRYGLAVRTVLCPRCGLLRTSPQMCPETTAAFYREKYRALYSSPHGPEELYADQVRRGQRYRHALRNALHDVEVVYEVGCGAGGILSPFREAGKRVAGCDMGAEYLAMGRREGLDLHHGGVGSFLEARDGEQAQLLFLVHVLEHFGDLRRELREVLEALAPGGLLFVEVPGLRDIDASPFYRGDLLRYLQNAHNYHFTAKTLGFVLQSLGLDLVYCDENATAIARRPNALCPRLTPAPKDEARRTLRYLGGLERRLASPARAPMPRTELSP